MKVLKVICGIIGFTGFFIVVGACGGLEQNLCTEAEFWGSGVSGLIMMIVGPLVGKSLCGEDF